MIAQLKTEAARRALTARLRFGFALDCPCDVYELVCKYDLSLRFTRIATMDGLYLNDGLTGSINVSTLRPSGHQRFTAAHELGHFYLRPWCSLRRKNRKDGQRFDGRELG